MTMNPKPTSESSIRFWRKAMFISIGFTVIPPLLGMGVTVFGMIDAFHYLDTAAPEGIGGNPAGLSQNVSLAMTTTAIGLVIAALGFIAFIICLIRYLTLTKHLSLDPARTTHA